MGYTGPGTVRVQGLTLSNFKNVLNGNVDIFDASKSDEMDYEADVLGIYGQNGSGKTAVVDAMQLLKYLLQGEGLLSHINDWPNASMENSDRTLHVEYRFRIDGLSFGSCDIWYDVTVGAASEHPVVLHETLHGRFRTAAKRTKKTIWFDSNQVDGVPVLSPKKLWTSLRRTGGDAVTDIASTKKMAKRLGMSFLFSKEFREKLENQLPEHPLTEVIHAMHRFSSERFFVIDQVYAGAVYTNRLQPIRPDTVPHGEGLGLVDQDSPGMLRIDKPNKLSAAMFTELTRQLTEINTILGVIVPGLEITLANVFQGTDSDVGDYVHFEFMSDRQGVTIPLRCESNGIRRIVSIASLLISVYNQRDACVVIDELDAGVFEYLLGELVKGIEDGGRGQLIFTSHNLRPLETLRNRHLLYTTTDPNRRYTRLPGIKASSNPRNVYYSNIVFGGEDGTCYFDAVNQCDIGMAFEDAWADD